MNTGSGLHTFVLYLGPHIAKVALAATTCHSLDFATWGETAYQCTPQPADSASAAGVTLWSIFLKIQMACFLWGAGTAIGELPPYFMSRAAAQAGEKMAELNDIHGDEAKAETLMDRAKVFILAALQKYGFWAILACASIPNPLFDLAGLACGHFGVPFFTFFGATFIGKAVVKAHGQSLFVIAMASKQNMQSLFAIITRLTPGAYKERVAAWLSTHIDSMQAQFTGAAGAGAAAGPASSRLAQAWDWFLGLTLFWFFLSIIDSLVQERLAAADELKLAEFDRQAAASATLPAKASPALASIAAVAAAPATPRSAKKVKAEPAASPAAPQSARKPAAAAKKTKQTASASPSPRGGAAAASPVATRTTRRKSASKA